MGKSSRVSKHSIKPRDKEDRISALPDSLLQHVLSFLPSTDEAVKTSFLSKRWRNQWTHVPDLIFRPFLGSGDNYGRFIENTLILHDSPKIKKFHLEYDSEWEVDPRFTSKLRFAIKKCVEELSLICHCDSAWYLLPEFMFDSASLVRLEIVNCYFMPKWRVNWPSLKSLKIDCRRLGLEDKFSLGIENVVCGSPSLEWMEFRGYSDEGVAVVSDSLKVLSFVDAAAPINISCLNLVEFNMVTEEWYGYYMANQMIESVMSGSPFIHSLKICSLTISRKLVVASKYLKVLHLQYIQTPTIQVSCPSLEKLDVLHCDEVTFQALNVPSSICATIDAYDPRCPNFVNELLVQFRHVNKLQIGRSLFKAVLSLDMEGQLSLPLLNNKWLTLDACYDFGLSIPGIAYALRSPILETLVINVPIVYSQKTLDKDLQDYWNSNGYTGLTCLESHLKTVKIIGLSEKDAYCKLALEFIEFLLMNAKVLKKMIVVLKSPGPSFAFEVSQKLLSFPRYSKCACIELSCST